jgi:hypothetical protein
MRLYGRAWSRREIEARVGRLEQVGGVRRQQWTEGPEAGVEHIQVRTGAGLAYTVLPSRGLDIGLAEFAGVPLCWLSANGEVHPAFFDAAGVEWLRTAVGGLLMTCGLTQVGAPCEDEGRAWGLHGRVHHLPARQVAAESAWVGDEVELRVSGVVEETAIFGEHLRLTREIRSLLGENRIAIRDQVENVGFAPTPHMLLYHFNFGFPLLDTKTQVEFPSVRVTPREESTPLAGYDRWEAPQADYAERVYYHELPADVEQVTVTLRNPRFPLPGRERPLTVRLSWSTRYLNRLVEWKMPGAGVHVLGIEPANCHVGGRAVERQLGTLQYLQPGESRTYELSLEVEA